MTALPDISAFTGSAVTEGDFKSALSDLRSYLAGLLDTGGDLGAARELLGIFGWDHILKSTGSSYTVTTGDRARWITCSSTVVGIGLPAAATAGDGFFFLLRNAGSSTLTVTPNGSETIDGAATKDLTGGQWALLISTGSVWRSVGSTSVASTLDGVTKFTAGGTWTKPSGVNSVWVEVVGGGGGYSYSDPDFPSGGAGGAAGGWVDVSAVATVSVTVGAAGTNYSHPNPATAGGSSSFGSYLTAAGGGAGGGTGSTGGTAKDVAASGLATRYGLGGVYGGVSPSAGIVCVWEYK